MQILFTLKLNMTNVVVYSERQHSFQLSLKKHHSRQTSHMENTEQKASWQIICIFENVIKDSLADWVLNKFLSVFYHNLPHSIHPACKLLKGFKCYRFKFIWSSKIPSRYWCLLSVILHRGYSGKIPDFLVLATRVWFPLKSREALVNCDVFLFLTLGWTAPNRTVWNYSRREWSWQM